MTIEENWRDELKSVTEKLKYILVNDDTETDVVITVGRGSSETKLSVHSLILFIGSDVLQKMLKEHAKINNDGLKEIKLPDVNPAAMRFVLKHIYFDFNDPEHEDGIDILFAALKFNLQDLIDSCVLKLKNEINVENVLRLYEEASKMAVNELIEFSKAFIFKNADKTFQQPQFLNISNATLCKLLKLDLQIDEISLFKSVICWGKLECKRSELEENAENVRFTLKKIVPLIRFTIMTIQDFSSVVLPENILDDKELIGIYHYLSMKNSSTEINVDPPAWLSSSSERIIYKKTKTTDVSLETAIKTKDKLLQYLKNISGHKTIFGLFAANVDDDLNEKVETMYELADVKNGLISVWMPSCNAGESQWNTFIDELNSKWKDGYLLQIVWNFNQNLLSTMNMSNKANELKSSSKKPARNKNQISKNAKDEKFHDLIEEGGDLNKMWKNHLDAAAVYLHKLQAAGVVAVCEIQPSMNGAFSQSMHSLFWNGPYGSVKLYQMTIDYLVRHHGLHSLLWAWSVDVSASDTENLMEYWPGEDYVDVVSVYIRNQKDQFNLDGAYEKLLSIVGDKPIAMGDIQVPPKPELLSREPRWAWFTMRSINDTKIQRLSFEYNNYYYYYETDTVEFESDYTFRLQNESLIHKENMNVLFKTF